MAMTPVEFHPLADREAMAARRWYYRVSPGVAAGFIANLRDTAIRIEANPHGWPRHLHGTRMCRLRNRFPYHLIYVIESTRVLVIAVAHDRRRPGYWRRRIP